MYLEQNLEKLNKKLAQYNICFENKGDKLLLVEKVAYSLNNLPGLKKDLMDTYKLRFQSEGSNKYWCIGNEGIKILSKRELKLEPSNSEEELRNMLTGYINAIKDEELKNCITKVLEQNPFYYEPGSHISPSCV